MDKKKLIEDVMKAFDDPRGVLKSHKTVEQIVEKLQFPGFDPSVLLLAHGDDEGWHEIRVPVRLDPITFPDLAKEGFKLVGDMFVMCAVNDIAELMVDGDTESKEPFLALFDGLKKRTIWPESFAISDKAMLSVKVGKLDEPAELEMTIFVRVIEHQTL